MKKIPLNSIVKTSLLLFGISLLLWNCRKEEFHNDIVLENFSSAYKQRTISLSELADVKKYIDQINPSNELGKTSEIEGAIFDQDNVLEVIDTLQNTNYSLRFTYPDTPASEFYNLIIGRTPEGDLTTPFVLKYVCDEDFVDNYIANDFDIQYFKGVIKLHKYTDFFSLDAFSRTTDYCPPELDAVGDPQVCEEQPIDGSSLSGGGSNNGGNYGDPNSGNDSGSSVGGGGLECSFWVSTNGPCAEDGTEIHPPEACGAGTGVQYVLIIECNMQRQTRTTNDCPSCSDTNPDGGIGLNQPSMESMREDLMRRLQMNDSNQINWVNDDMNNQNVIDIISFLNLHKDPNGNDTPYAINFAQEAIDLLERISDSKFERYKELYDLIKENPWVLLEDCIVGSGLDTSHYLDLYNLPFPQECSDRLTNSLGLGPHQPITDGNVPLANIDYYGVEITNYPDFDNDGIPDSESEMYQAFRNNFVELASGEKENFQFSCDVPGNPTDTGDISWTFEPATSQDAIDFVSDDPIGSVLFIEAEATDVLPNIAADDGAIIMIHFNNHDWTIATINSDNNGTQPFSGNRQWGWYINSNGNFEFFTRAVDVAKISKLFNILPGSNTECQQDTYYNVAEVTWENMQEEIAQWVNDHDGQATIAPKTAIRVDKNMIEELLTSNETINEINCD